MAKYTLKKISSKVSENGPKPNYTINTVKRDNANVEAELGETVVTLAGSSDKGIGDGGATNNYFEMYNIAGKKHSKGGTPLSLSENSFIFSDNKKMIVKDPSVLSFFGMDSNKPMTYAQISKSWIPEVNSSKAILINDNVDNISRKSAELTMNNAAFKIAALKLHQEASKGFKGGVTSGLEPFFDKLKVDPKTLFNLNQDNENKINGAVGAALGGMVGIFNHGGEHDSTFLDANPCPIGSTQDAYGNCVDFSGKITKKRNSSFELEVPEIKLPGVMDENYKNPLTGEKPGIIKDADGNLKINEEKPSLNEEKDDVNSGNVELTEEEKKKKHNKDQWNKYGADYIKAGVDKIAGFAKTLDKKAEDKRMANVSALNRPIGTMNDYGAFSQQGQQFQGRTAPPPVINPTYTAPINQTNFYGVSNTMRAPGLFSRNGGQIRNFLPIANKGLALVSDNTKVNNLYPIHLQSQLKPTFSFTNADEPIIDNNKTEVTQPNGLSEDKKVETKTLVEEPKITPWYEYKDQNGEIFYYNQDTKESKWTLPEGMTANPIGYVSPSEDKKVETKIDIVFPEAEWGSVEAPKTQYNYIINKLSTNEAFKDALFKEYQKAAKENVNFGTNYQTTANREKVVKKNKEDVFQDYLMFQKRNLVIQSHGLSPKDTKQNVDKINGVNRVSNNTIHDWAEKYKVDFTTVDKATSEQLSFIAFENLTKNKSEYNPLVEKVMSPFSSNPYGLDDETVMTVNGVAVKGRISKADGYYTNTTAGEVSMFTDPGPDPCPACPDGSIPIKLPNGKCPCPTITKDPGPCPICPDGTIPVRLPDGTCPCEPNYKKLPDPRTIINPIGYRKQDIASFNRALNSLYTIPEIRPFNQVTSTALPERTYYSPERELAANYEGLQNQLNVTKSFGTGQSSVSDTSVVANTAFQNAANTIKKYEDANINLYNVGENSDTMLARSDMAARDNAANQTNRENDTVDQNLFNSISAAKDKILQIGNQAYTNAIDRYNINLTNENFKADPYSGKVFKLNDRPLVDSQKAADDFGKEFNSFHAKMPTINGDLAMKAFLAYKSGKYTITTDDGVRNPNEVDI